MKNAFIPFLLLFGFLGSSCKSNIFSPGDDKQEKEEPGTTTDQTKPDDKEKTTDSEGEEKDTYQLDLVKEQDRLNNEFLKSKITTRFLAYSDNHTDTNTSDPRNKRMSAILSQVKSMVTNSELNDGYNKLDAVLDVGDMTNGGTSAKLNVVKNIYNSILDSSTKLVITTGNHEYENNIVPTSFKSVFGVDPTNDVKINGYHFITIDCDGETTTERRNGDSWIKGWDYTDATVQKATNMIIAAYKDTGPDKPIFVCMHIGNLNTVIGTDKYVDASDITATRKFDEIFSRYSNLVVFSGHSHFNVNDDCSIHQEKYTSINAGSNAYTMRSYNGYLEYNNGVPNEFKPNPVPLYCYHHDNYNQLDKTLDDNPTSSVSQEFADYQDRTYVCNGLIIEINEANQLRIRSWNGINKRFNRKVWVVDSYKKDEFRYTPGRFDPKYFFFDEGAEIKVSKSFDKKVCIKIPKISKNSIDGRVYKIKLLDSKGTLVRQKIMTTDYYNERYEYPLSFYFQNLKEGEQYKVTAQCFNSLYASNLIDEQTISSNILTKEFTYSEDSSTIGELEADIADVSVDAENKTLVNNNKKYGLQPYVIGVPKIYHDDTIDKDVLKTSGDENDLACLENYWYLRDKLSNSFSIEAYLKLDNLNSGSLISGENSVTTNSTTRGGFGLNISSNSFAFRTRYLTSVNETTSSTLTVNKWYHVVATYDYSSRQQTIYIDGVSNKSSSISSAYTSLPIGPKGFNTQLYIGGDVTYQNTSRVPTENHKSFTLATLRMYSYALSGTQVSNLYSNI